MNEKFYDLSEEKQSQILNAAYKVFATNQYKKAPTSEIAAEAGISKSLYPCFPLIHTLRLSRIFNQLSSRMYRLLFILLWMEMVSEISFPVLLQLYRYW